jgi:hypothetical protein
VIPFGHRHLRRAIAEYVEHYHRERNHQDWTTRSSMPARSGRRGSGFAGGRGSVGCSITTNEPRKEYGWPMRHYGLTSILAVCGASRCQRRPAMCSSGETRNLALDVKIRTTSELGSARLPRLSRHSECP